MKLTIDRNTWLRGTGSANSYLLRKSDGRKCCLGFLACSLGASQDQIENIAAPNFTNYKLNWPHGLVTSTQDYIGVDNYPNNYIGNVLMLINDNDKISDLERETQLINIFKQIGIEVEFIN